LMSALFIVLFFGGWLPILNIYFFYWIPGWVWFATKLVLVMFAYVWVRATLPRYRFDQLMLLGWKVILPLSLVFFIFTAVLYFLYSYIIHDFLIAHNLIECNLAFVLLLNLDFFVKNTIKIKRPYVWKC
jgi:NADH-quinone oxidoreductase subunit H